MSSIVSGPSGRWLFVHIPKTGGQWFELVCKSLCSEPTKFVISRCGAGNHPLPEDVIDEHTIRFTFIRHPVTWYESWWKYQAGWWMNHYTMPGWWSTHPLQHCGSDNFDTFIRLVLHHEPGFVSRMYEWYIGPPGRTKVHHVGRFERLHADATHFLRALGYDVNEEQVSKIPRENASPCRKGLPIWNPDLREAIIRAERPAIRRWYNSRDEHGRFT